MTRLLIKEANVGVPIRMWCVGLESPELHIRRVRRRVACGGHDVPEETIRNRYESSRRNLVGLIPHLLELKLYDNSPEADPHLGDGPDPQLILHFRRGVLLGGCPLPAVPQWAKPAVQATLKVMSPREIL